VVAVIEGRVALRAVVSRESDEVDPQHEWRTVVFWDAETFAEVRRRELDLDEAPLAVTTVDRASLMATVTHDRSRFADLRTIVADVQVRRVTGAVIAVLPRTPGRSRPPASGRRAG
jgi:hypothetical protein